jgi:hypothetical protein
VMLSAGDDDFVRVGFGRSFHGRSFYGWGEGGVKFTGLSRFLGVELSECLAVV